MCVRAAHVCVLVYECVSDASAFRSCFPQNMCVCLHFVHETRCLPNSVHTIKDTHINMFIHISTYIHEYTRTYIRMHLLAPNSLPHSPSLSHTPTHDVFFFLISNLISATKKEESTPRTTSAHLPISRPHHVHHLSASQELSLALDNVTYKIPPAPRPRFLVDADTRACRPRVSSC